MRDAIARAPPINLTILPRAAIMPPRQRQIGGKHRPNTFWQMRRRFTDDEDGEGRHRQATRRAFRNSEAASVKRRRLIPEAQPRKQSLANLAKRTSGARRKRIADASRAARNGYRDAYDLSRDIDTELYGISRKVLNFQPSITSAATAMAAIALQATNVDRRK